MNQTKHHPILENSIGDNIQALAISFSSSSTPHLDAQVLISHIIDKPRSWLLAHKDEKLTPVQQNALIQAASEVDNGIPLPYLIGHWWFYGLDFILTPSVLIPRPETELLVEHAYNWLTNHPTRRRALDLGTGSGCIAISLAYHFPDLHFIAADISSDALSVSYGNAVKHKVESQIDFVQADLYKPIPSSSDIFSTPFDLITANLPYIPFTTLKYLDVFNREPTLALNGGSDGLSLIRECLQTTAPYLAPGGCILLEIEAHQGKSGLELASAFFPDAEIKIFPDLSGFDRLLIIKV